MPLCPIPVFDECLEIEGRLGSYYIGTYCPDITRRNSANSVQCIILRTSIRAGNNAPLCPIPVLGECLFNSITVEVISHGPDIAAGNGGNAIKSAIICLRRVWTVNNSPTAAGR